MDFFSLDFIIFFFLVFFGYYLISPNKRKKWLLVANVIFWITQSYFTLILAFICLILDYFFIFKSSNNLSFSSKNKFFLPYLFLLLIYYFLPLPTELLNAGIYPKVITNRFLPCGLFIMCFQSIRNINLISRGEEKLDGLSFIDWVKMQLLFISFYCGPINNLKNLNSELKGEKRFSFDNIVLGFKLLFWALLKKMVIADRLISYMNSFKSGSIIIGGYEDAIIAIFIPFFYITFTIGAYCSLSKSLGYFLGINSLRNIDIYAYLTGIGNFWSRWIITLKQTLDEIFIESKFCKAIVYSFLIIFNLIFFMNSKYILFCLPLFVFFIYFDFYLQQMNYFDSTLMAIFSKITSFVLIALFWSICFLKVPYKFDFKNKFNGLLNFTNSDFLIFFIILLIIIIHILRRKIKNFKMTDTRQFEDISLVGIVFLGYFVLMFGVF